jgi:hypothetical protein
VKQKPAISTTGKGVGRKSQCESLPEVIMAKAEVGLSAQRIYQDLVEENGFTDSYQSVKRFVTVPPQIVHGYLSIGISPIFYAVIFIFKGKTCCRNKRRQQEPPVGLEAGSQLKSQGKWLGVRLEGPFCGGGTLRTFVGI